MCHTPNERAGLSDEPDNESVDPGLRGHGVRIRAPRAGVGVPT